MKLTPEQINNLEDHWRKRCDSICLTEEEEREAQAHFFCGAIACHSVFNGEDFTFPPRWYLTIIRGDLISQLQPMEVEV